MNEIRIQELASAAGQMEHFDELRSFLIRIAITTVLFGGVALLFKEDVFAVILACRRDMSRRTIDPASLAKYNLGFVIDPVQVCNLFQASVHILIRHCCQKAFRRDVAVFL